VVHRVEEAFPILRGYYISPWSRSILQNNEIDGLMFDITWYVVRQYLTMIIMDIYCNVGIPLTFTFDVAETKELSEQLYMAFMKRFEIDFSQYIIVLSDQGTALRPL
jgi:hypothetical protein